MLVAKTNVELSYILGCPQIIQVRPFFCHETHGDQWDSSCLHHAAGLEQLLTSQRKDRKSSKHRHPEKAYDWLTEYDVNYVLCQGTFIGLSQTRLPKKKSMG